MGRRLVLKQWKLFAFGYYTFPLMTAQNNLLRGLFSIIEMKLEEIYEYSHCWMLAMREKDFIEVFGE